MSRALERSFTVLLVEDNEADAQLAAAAFAETGISISLFAVTDGLAALDFLARRTPFDDAVRPQLILLDLNLPNLDGRDVLGAIKESDEFKQIPVVVLTTSEAPEDISTAYRLHANCYVTKPQGFDEFVVLVRSIVNFWATIARLPQ